MTRFNQAALERVGDVVHGRPGAGDRGRGEALLWAATIVARKHPRAHLSTSLSTAAIATFSSVPGLRRATLDMPSVLWRGAATPPTRFEFTRLRGPAGEEGALDEAPDDLLDALAAMPPHAAPYPPENPARGLRERLRRRLVNRRVARDAARRLRGLEIAEADPEDLGRACRPLIDAAAPKLGIYAALSGAAGLVSLALLGRAQNAGLLTSDLEDVAVGELKTGDWRLTVELGEIDPDAPDKLSDQLDLAGPDLDAAIRTGRPLRTLRIRTDLTDPSAPRVKARGA